MRYEYLVVEIRDTIFRGRQSAEQLQNLFNHYAGYGYRFVHMMSEDVRGRLGLGNTSGVLVTFERQAPAGAESAPEAEGASHRQ